MNPKEFWGDWAVHPGERIHVAGTKRDGRVRDVPLVDLPTRPELTRAGFRSALRRLDQTVTPKLARKTFDRYEWYEVVAYLREDAGGCGRCCRSTGCAPCRE